MQVTHIQEMMGRVRNNISLVVVGKAQPIELMLVALLCEGHILIEDVPGTGKTTVAKALAASLGCAFRRIQFTPDLLPSDITGVSVFNPESRQFEFQAGPIFAQVVLADEINRAGPRTQSALLEAMQERQVTNDGVTRPLSRPFLVMATQNPIELQGTFPLPEAQLDRFLLRLQLGYPSADEERAILRRFRVDDPLESLEPVLQADALPDLSAICRQIHVHPILETYIVRLSRATRDSKELALGVSPRASMAMYRAAQALAAMRGRTYVTPDDIQELLLPVWAHRLVSSAQNRLHRRGTELILRQIADQVAVPVEEDWETGKD